MTKNDAKDALLPCEHCGPGKSRCRTVECPISGRWLIFCGACGSSSGSRKTEKQAIELWNTRYSAALASEREKKLVEALRAVNATTFSHVDGRDLLAELHPRKTLDIKRRVDGHETWFEADWLSRLYEVMKEARTLLATYATEQQQGGKDG